MRFGTQKVIRRNIKKSYIYQNLGALFLTYPEKEVSLQP